MNFFDLHCDTLYEAVTKNKDIFKNTDLHISIDRGRNFSNWTQCFAVWIPDGLVGSKALNLFERCVNKFDQIKSCLGNTSINPILTVEGGSELIKDLSKIEYLHKRGVKAFTLTWNGRCAIGDGVGVAHPEGITDFGKESIKQMQDVGIIVDVSHASIPLFWDVMEISKKPVIASHSNSYSVCPHKRNLTDDQFKAIKKLGGIVGITFCDEFLKSGKGATLNDILKHVEHFLSLDGENVLCIGSDFDGADVLEDVKGIESIDNIYNYFLKHNYKESIIKKIFSENAQTFLKNL